MSNDYLSAAGLSKALSHQKLLGWRTLCKNVGWDMILDDIQETQQRGDRKHALNLLHILHHYLRPYLGGCPSRHP